MGATPGDIARSGSQVAPVDESASDRRAAISTVEQVLALLTWAAAFDRIERGRFEAEAWLAALEGFGLETARAAVTEHYKRSRFPVTPADVIEIIENGDVL